VKQRSVLALTCWLAALAASAIIVARTTVSADMSAFLPARPSAEQQLLVSQLREGVLARTILIGIEGADATLRSQLSNELAQQMRDGGDFLLVRNGASDSLARDEQVVLENRYLLSPTVDQERFTVTGLHQAIADSIDLLASPAGVLFKPIFARDPTGETVSLLESLAPHDAPRTRFSAWVSNDGQRALLIAQTRAAGSDTEAQAALLSRLQTQFDKLALGLGITDGHLLVTGQPAFAVATRAAIHSEIVRLSLISTIAVVVLLLLVYRSPLALALGILPIVTGALVGVAAVSVGFGGVHGLTIGFGTTLIGEALDYTVYYFVQSQQGAGAEEDWRRRFWPTIRLGMLTSICGFMSLLFSGFPGLAQLGLYSVAGLLAAAGVTRFVLPVLRPASLAIPSFGAIEERLRRAVAAFARLAPAALLLPVIALVILVLHRGPLWNPGLSGLSPLPPAVEQLDASLRHDLGAPVLRYLIVVSTPTRETTLAETERVSARLDGLVTAGVIGGFDTPTRFLPSRQTQLQRQAALPDSTTLAANLRQALVGLPVRIEHLQGFEDDVLRARTAPLVTDATLAGSSLQLGVDSLLITQPDRVAAVLPLHPAGATPDRDVDAAAVRTALAASGSSAAVFVDLLMESNQLYSEYLHEAIVLSLAGLAAIVVLLALALRSAERVLRVLAPLLAAVLVVIAGLSLAGVHLTLLHLIGTLLIVAVGSNYALFFDRRELGVADDGRVLASLLLANLATVVGFGALATSSVPVLRAIGVTVGPGAILAMMFSILFAARARRPL